MDTRVLQIFVEVVRTKSFSRAAGTVNLTQSAVSKAIRNLEDELGAALLDRGGSHISVTHAGEIVLQRAMLILGQQSEIFSELSELRGLRRGKLRLGLPPIGSGALFAPVYAVFRKIYPGIDIELTELGSRHLEELVSRGELDLGVSLLPVSEEFEFQEVQREQLVALLPRQHELSSRTELPFSLLSSEQFILFERGFAINTLITAACHEAGFSPSIAARTNQIGFMAELVRSGLGAGFLPEFVARQHVGVDVVCVALAEPQVFWRVAWIWKRRSDLAQAAKAWLQVAHQNAKPASAPAQSD